MATAKTNTCRGSSARCCDFFFAVAHFQEILHTPSAVIPDVGLPQAAEGGRGQPAVWNPALMQHAWSQKRDASLRWHDGVSGVAGNCDASMQKPSFPHDCGPSPLALTASKRTGRYECPKSGRSVAMGWFGGGEKKTATTQKRRRLEPQLFADNRGRNAINAPRPKRRRSFTGWLFRFFLALGFWAAAVGAIAVVFVWFTRARASSGLRAGL